MTHDRCSELLPGYVRGQLARELAGDVRDHLAGCEECRAEQRAVAALAVAAPPDSHPLDDIERARLHRGLAQELFTVRANADVAGAGAGRRRWAGWVVPAATAAAVLAGAAVMTLGGGVGGSDSDESASLSAEADAGGGDSESSVEDSAAQVGGKDKGRSRKNADVLSSEAAAGTGGSQYAAPGEPRPVFEADAGTLTPSELSEIGRGDVFRSFAAAYGPGDGAALYDGFLDALAKEAGGSEIEECAATLPRDGSLIPAYAATAEYDGEDALVLGFATSDPGSPKLDRYVMWVWARGDCSQPIDTLFEYIEPR